MKILFALFYFLVILPLILISIGLAGIIVIILARMEEGLKEEVSKDLLEFYRKNAIKDGVSFDDFKEILAVDESEGSNLY